MSVSHLIRELRLFLKRRRFGRRFVGLAHEAPFGELCASEAFPTFKDDLAALAALEKAEYSSSYRRNGVDEGGATHA